MQTTEFLLKSFPFPSGAFDDEMKIQVHEETYVGSLDPVASFIVPVHNQESMIVGNLELIREHAALNHEIVVIADGCTDGSLEKIMGWFATVRNQPARTARVVVVEIREGVFETISDSIGIHLSFAPLIIEIQADMSIQHPGFDKELFDALALNPDVFAVSGRGAHSLSRLPHFRLNSTRPARMMAALGLRASRWWNGRRGAYIPSLAEYLLSDSIGRVGDLVDLPTQLTKSSCLYIHETVMRGPLAFSRENYTSLGGFDTAAFFLGNDDHDLVLRAWIEKRQLAAYLPIRFDSPLEAGSTRAVKSPAETRRFQALQSYYVEAERESVLSQHGPTNQSRTRSIRKLPRVRRSTQ
ncbi:glycosyltransferase family A protein [Cryobacterium sp. TMB1-7]|uniref:glycosyltransferase family A protein n=1 Tax=Cryobacterium sp. TMB1-7 TaxID=2555866 RepID=UPI00106D22A3|nr:glycosyltransferase family A protein [Cryobacterium sp. TMB1-7]TFC61639.1 glycosyltransferase family 2 protein [Cryobacterium sp. TMB1-7]